MAVVVLPLVLSACGSGGSQSAQQEPSLTVSTVQRVFRAHGIPVLNTGCGRISLTQGHSAPNYPADSGLVCQLTAQQRLTLKPGAAIRAQWQVSAFVAADPGLLTELLTAPGARADLLSLSTESFRVANVLVVADSGNTHLHHLPARITQQTRAATVELAHLAALAK